MASDFSRKEGGLYATMLKTYPPDNAPRYPNEPRLESGTPVEILDEGYTAATVRSQSSGATIPNVPYAYLNIPSGGLPWIIVTSTWLDGFRFYRKAMFRLLPTNELHLRFLDGFICAYPDVNDDQWDDFFSAESYGGWIWDNLIRQDRFYRIIRAKTAQPRPARRKDNPLRRLRPTWAERTPGHPYFGRKLKPRDHPG